jgi:hypothetical protein
MQFGSPQKFLPAFISGAVISLLVVGVIYICKPISVSKLSALCFGIYGTYLLAYAFSPYGQVPPQRSIVQRIRWFFASQSATPMHYNRPAYYLGLFFIGVSFVISAVAK